MRSPLPPPLLAAALGAALLLAACTSTSEGTPTTEAPSPTATPTPEATRTPPPALPGGTVLLADLDLPDGCSRVFDSGFWERPFIEGIPIDLAVGVSPCGARALAGVSALAVRWAPRGFDAPTVSATLRPRADGHWTGVVTFPERGTWLAADRSGGFLSFFDIQAADGGGLLDSPPGLPLPAIPRMVAVLDAGGTQLIGEFSADFGGIGLIRNPDRLVSVHPGDEGRRVLAANLETGAIEELLRAEDFVDVVAAPDGSAVAVTWSPRASATQIVAIVDATTGDSTRLEDSSGSRPQLAWAPDSSALLMAGDRLRLIAPDGALLVDRDLPDGESPPVTWSPDSSYALLRFFTGGDRLERLDLDSLEIEPVFRGAGVRLFRPPAIAPVSGRIAIAWVSGTPGDGQPIHVSILADTATSARLEDHVVASVELAGSFAEFGGLSWSPDERSLAFMASGVVIGDAAPRTVPGSEPSSGSIVGVLDLASGAVRQVADSDEFYATFVSAPVWSSDGRTLFALRFPCSGCGPPSSAVDVIDVASGRILRAFEDTAYLGPTADGRAQLLGTAAGLLRADGRGSSDLLVATNASRPFGGSYARLDDRLVAVALAAPIRQILAANADGAGFERLGVPTSDVAALLDANHAIVRDHDGWARQALDDGTLEPYAASGGTPEKLAFILSPSGALALDVDYESFAILDAARPEAVAVVPRRPTTGALTPTPAWSPDERQVAFAGDGTIAIFGLERGDERTFDLADLGVDLDPDDPIDHLWSMTWSPDGALLFATLRSLWSLDVDTGTATELAAAPTPGAFFAGTLLVHSPNGDTLAAATEHGVFVLESSGTWREIAAIGISQTGGSLRWSPDGDAVAYSASHDLAPSGLIVAATDGSGAYSLVGAPSLVRVLDWLADGRIVWVATALGE